MLASCIMPNPLPNFWQNYSLKPDVTVTKFNLPILTLETVSGNDYPRTVTEVILNCAEMLRVWHTHSLHYRKSMVGFNLYCFGMQTCSDKPYKMVFECFPAELTPELKQCSYGVYSCSKP